MGRSSYRYPTRTLWAGQPALTSSGARAEQAAMADEEDPFQSAKTRANDKLREGLFDESIELYCAALDVATDQKQRAVVLANRAHAFLSAEPPRPAVT